MDLETVVSLIKENAEVVLILGVLVMIFGLLIIGGIVKLLRQVKLEKTGVIGSAVVTRLKQTGTYKNNNPKLAMELEVTLPGHAPYRIEKKAYVPAIYHPRVQPGMTVEVIADPERLDNAKYLGLRFRDEI